jgi:RNA polymerase sigma-70 factor (ECF subfamily)
MSTVARLTSPLSQDARAADAAPAPDPTLEKTFEQHRRELTGYCYRMLGAGSEAEDAVQETMLRAWRAYDRFEGRASVRSWLYRIATNVCVDMVRSPQRRARPMALGPSTRAAEAVLEEQLAEERWIMPVLDADVISLDGDPADVATARESVRLAFVAALQHLPPRQRAALILCEVLKWSAVETAELLESSVASVNSALQRARATLAERHDEPLDPFLDPAHQDLLARYVDAFERYDIPLLVALLRDDVVLSMPPWNMWLQGPDDLVAWFLGPGKGCQGSRLVPIEVNGTAGFGSYRLTRPGLWEPFAVQVIEVAGGRIVGHHNFLYPEHFADFGLPSRIEG